MLSFELLPKKKLTAYNRTRVVDSYGLNGSITSTRVNIIDALYAPTNGSEQRLVPEGFRDMETYTLYTGSRLYAAVEGSTRIASQVLLPKSDGTTITCEVIKEQDWSYDPLEQQYVYVLVKVNER